MANITQTIPALTAGISQQPDEQKIPGQVKNMVNALPDVTQGLLKRPGGKFVASLSDGTNNSYSTGKWFHYYRDENEQYIGQIIRRKNSDGSSHADDGKVRMWDCLTGAEKDVVNNHLNYLVHTDDEDIQTLTLNDFTYINNRSVETEMDNNVTEPLNNYQKEIYVELKKVSYARQYSLNLFNDTTTSTVTTVTRIDVRRAVDSSNSCQPPTGTAPDYDINNRGQFPQTGTEPGTGAYTSMCNNKGAYSDASHEDLDSYCPNVATRIFKVSHGNPISPVDRNGVVGNYTVSASSGNATDRKDLFFRIATTGQSVAEGVSSTPEYHCRYTTTHDLLHGGSGWQVGDTVQVWMKNARYDVTIMEVSEATVQANLGLIRPTPTSFDTKTTVTAESILGDIRSEIIASGNFSASDVTQIGTGLHIKRSDIFNASTPVGELLNVVGSKIQDAGDLPSQCKHGMVVEVVNSNAEEDNYFVKFIGKQKSDGTFIDGEGTWEECPKPGRLIRYNYSKMPVVLIRTADGNFRLTPLDGTSYTLTGDPKTYYAPKWDDAEVGDDVTNSEPSFIGKNINKLLFFRNRFAILADEYIVLSRPGDFTNFWNKSAIQFIASDPIDISASSIYPATLYDGIQTNTGLVLFSKNQQFMLTTDSDVFSPLTAKINALSTYNFNYSTNPISLGTTLGFLDNAGKYSRFFEMAQLQREGEPQIIEQSAVVSRLFEKDLKLISNSRENSVIFFSEEGTSTLYGYRYFDQITERKLASWFKWTLTGTIQYHCMQDDNLYVVVDNGGKHQLLKYAIKMDSNTLALAENRVHLDHLMSLSISSSASYNRDTDRTSFSKPTGLESSNQLAVYSVVDTGINTLGRYNKAYFVGNNIEVDGDWRGTNITLGYLFTMEVELPTIFYITQSGENWRADTRANTILHRVKFGFGPIGLYETTLKRTGRVDYTEVFELTAADGYQATTSPINDDNNLRTVPIYDRNLNTNLTIKSTHPAPATIHNMTWEGVYNNNFYKRV